MEIYIKNEDGNLIKTSLFSLFLKAFTKPGFKTENGHFEENDVQWIKVVQHGVINPFELIIFITFEEEGNKVLGVQVYVDKHELR